MYFRIFYVIKSGLCIKQAHFAQVSIQLKASINKTICCNKISQWLFNSDF